MNKLDLSGKTILLTGAASGLGRELALQLGQMGCHLLLVDRDQDGLTTLMGELYGEHQSFPCDLSDLSERKTLIQNAKARHPEILINCAGIGSHSQLYQLDVDEVERVMQVNALAPLELMAGLSPLTLIVSIGSVAGEMNLPSMGLYGASKASLHAFTHSIGLEGIRTLLVILGPMRGTNFPQSIKYPRTGQPKWYRGLDLDVKVAARGIIQAMIKGDKQIVLPDWYQIVFAIYGLLGPLMKFVKSQPGFRNL